MSGSTVDWSAQSRYGRWLYQPYFASSNARSRYSIDGPMLVKPRYWSVAVAQRGIARGHRRGRS